MEVAVKCRLTLAVLSLVLLPAPVMLLAADLQKGLDAFAAGDYATSLAECEPLAEEGNVEAMFCVGRLYANGFGVAMDDALALKWYGLAAAGGHAEAQYNLAVMHANGWGVPMSDTEAAGFYQQAADSGFVPAQLALGQCYDSGLGVKQDLQAAYMWFDIAARADDLAARSERDRIRDRLTADELAAAEAKVSQWLQSSGVASAEVVDQLR